MVQLVLFVIIIILATCAASETALKGQLLTFCAESSAWRVSDPCLEACGFPLTATCPSALYLIPCPRITSLGHWKMHQNPCLYWLVYSTYSLLHSSLCFLLLLLFLPMLLWSLSREKLLRIVSLIRDIVLGFCFFFVFVQLVTLQPWSLSSMIGYFLWITWKKWKKSLCATNKSETDTSDLSLSGN